ncbi:hypothetical protein D9758_007310 [Tetrapyrgos nigripes]|uniref:Alpha/beta-hydrolase n=1 Tax=Tetrapyrgos nigripes TaxID=182062 RepID=A0A8H5GAW2_9AGAR|nr:hypothetical protein D9758_007310 [Tetrapyrgos nigripes]
MCPNRASSSLPLAISVPRLDLMTRFTSSGLLLGLVSLSAHAVLAQGFDWTSIEPSANFSWVDCYSRFQCAQFKAPLNYSDPDNGQSAAVAVVKLAAQVDSSAPEYGGPVFMNPGGPEVSGVNFLVETGPVVQSILGTQFDLFSFDPRGVNFSTPKASVFNTDEEHFAFFQDERADLNSTPYLNRGHDIKISDNSQKVGT